MKLFLICAEKSGSNIIKQVLERLQKNGVNLRDIEIRGVVYDDVADEFGVKTLFLPSEIAVLGIGDILTSIPRIVSKINLTAKEIATWSPDLVLSVDAYDFCYRVVKKAKQLGAQTKFIHIVAPSVWAYWSGRAKNVVKYFDHLFYLLPFEKKYFPSNDKAKKKEEWGEKKYISLDNNEDVEIAAESAKTEVPEWFFFVFVSCKKRKKIQTARYNNFTATFVGFPATFQERDASIVKDKKLIGITVGSRRGEIERHKNIMLSALARLRLMDKHLHFVVLATPDFHEELQQFFAPIKNILVVSDEAEKRKIIQKCQLVISKSGTNSIEIGALGTAMIVYYKVAKMTAMFARMFAKIKFVNLFNITTSRMIVPELIQSNATAENIANLAYRMVNDDTIINEQLHNVKHAISMMQNRDGKPIDIISNSLKCIFHDYGNK